MGGCVATAGRMLRADCGPGVLRRSVS